MIAATPRPARAPGAWIPWAFVLFFVVVTAVNGVMIWLALDSWTGLSTGEAYDRGLVYNHNIDAARRQAGLGWQCRLTARLVGSARAEAELELADAQGRSLSGAAIEASFERPLQPGADFVVALEPQRPGLYRAQFELPLLGVWDAHVLVRRGDDRYVLQQRLMLR
jgi:nitrogen fixation protein FixH